MDNDTQPEQTSSPIPSLKTNYNWLRTLTIGFAIVSFCTAIGVIGYFWTINNKPVSFSSKYNLVYCFGHDGTVNQIKVVNNKITEPNREGFLANPSYDYHCYTVDPNTLNKLEISIEQLNGQKMLFINTSPDGLTVQKEQDKPKGNTIGGLFFSNIYLTKGQQKKLIVNEQIPVKEFTFIGWIVK